jgi:hypothetical protein
MSNPVHPKVLGGLAGGVGGGSIGSLLLALLEQSHYYQHLTVASQQALAGLLTVGLALVGSFVTGYLSKWEPAVSKEAGSVIHVLDPDETQAAAESWLDAKWAALKAEVYGSAVGPTVAPVSLPAATSPAISEAPKLSAVQAADTGEAPHATDGE